MTTARPFLWFWLSMGLAIPSFSSSDTPPVGNLLWDGRDPFHQPAHTTSYYGSGDLDGDGQLTAADVADLDLMAHAILLPSQEADVNGDGRVDAADVELLRGALASGNLPAAWNRLTSRAARESWLSKALAIDSTDDHTPYSYWNQCLGFATQTFVNFSYYRGDLYTTYFGGGPTVFNIPTYVGVVYSNTFGHAIDAVLVGDSPLRFEDWLFIEPQSDGVVHPGMWDMPFDTNVQLVVPSEIWQGGFNQFSKLTFHVSQTGVTLVSHAPDLQLERGDEIPPLSKAHPDYWTPTLVPDSTGVILVGSTRRDFPAGNHDDLYVSSLDSPEEIDREPLLGVDDYNRLLDVVRDRQGVVHVLWSGMEDSVPGVFYGRLDLSTHRIAGKRRLSDGPRSVRMGRIFATGADSLHVFWLELMNNSDHPYPTGIYWTASTGTEWQPAENLAPLPFISLFDLSSWWRRPDVLRYYFDVQEAADGHLVLVWNEPKNPPNTSESDQFVIKSRTFDGAWAPPAVIFPGGSAGVALARDAAHRLHLVYSTDTERIENRGKLFHRISVNGHDWSPPVRLDSSGQACCARMAAGSAADVFVAWMEPESDQEHGFWRRYDGSSWQRVKKLEGKGKGVWYPQVARLADGSMAAVWSSRSNDVIGVGSQHLAISVEPPDGPWLETPAMPGFRAKVRITGSSGAIPGTKVTPCIAETLCVAGALPDRAEVFIRVVGPRPNGKLWPTIVKFSTSRIEVWIERTATGDLQYYDLAAAGSGDRLLSLDGLIDKLGFDSVAGSAVAAEPEARRGSTAPFKAAAEPAPPDGPWLETAALPGFRTKVRITGAGEVIAGQRVSSCIAETLCVSGALPDRAEVFVRVVGPRPNGKLWPTIVKFSTSRIEVWIQQTGSGDTRYYDLVQALPGERIVPLAGLIDKEGFVP